MSDQPVEILIPAGGASIRMGGRDKLLMDIAGEPLMTRVVRRAVATGLRVIVTLPQAGAADRQAALVGEDVDILSVADARTGMAASFRAYAARARAGIAVMVLPADMPEMTTADMNAVIAAFLGDGATRVHRGTSNDQPGHPVILPADLVSQFAGLTGDQGARVLLAGEAVVGVPLPDAHAITDLDTPADWDRWHADN